VPGEGIFVNSIWRERHYVANRIITGPQSLLLMLDLQPERVETPVVTAIQICPVYGQPLDEIVREAVLSGTDRANREFGTNLHLLEIRYS
jgi:hypothetical protein